MKINKIIGLSVAVCGVALSFAGASALYVKGATNAGFGIGAGTWGGSDGTINYKINNASSGTVTPEYRKSSGTDVGTGLGGEFTQIHYSFELSATFADGMPDQTYVVGNFEIKLTNINSALLSASKVYIAISGYDDNTLGAKYYKNAFMASNSEGDAITEDTYTNAKDIVVKSTHVQTVDVYFKVNSAVVDEALLALDEAKAFDISAKFTAPSSSFKYAYVVGKGNMWTEDDKFAMVPNIKKEIVNEDDYEWMYNGLAGTLGEGKCKKESTWSADPNAVLDSSKIYDVYWSGKGSDQAAFNARS